MRKATRFLWAFLSCAFGIGAVAIAIPPPFGGLLLVLAGGIALASKSRQVWLDLFVLEGRGAQLFAGNWFIAGLILCINYYWTLRDKAAQRRLALRWVAGKGQ